MARAVVFLSWYVNRMKLDLGSGQTRIEGYTPWDWSTNNDVSFLPFA
ncbi:hypothetical protein UFOVP1391_1, partial [uncultured Caudovirales phage]